MKKKGETALNLMKKQRRMKRDLTKQEKIKIEREKRSILVIESWISFSLEEASKEPDTYSTEESITLMTRIDNHPNFLAIIEKLEGNGFDVKYSFGSGPKNRPILTIIISWDHHLKKATEDIKTEKIHMNDIMEEPINEE